MREQRRVSSGDSCRARGASDGAQVLAAERARVTAFANRKRRRAGTNRSCACLSPADGVDARGRASTRTCGTASDGARTRELAVAFSRYGFADGFAAKARTRRRNGDRGGTRRRGNSVRALTFRRRNACCCVSAHRRELCAARRSHARLWALGREKRNSRSVPVLDRSSLVRFYERRTVGDCA